MNDKTLTAPGADKAFESMVRLTEEDGVKHIRIDNRAKLELGRMLDSQYLSLFNYPGLGPFNTTEGLWYYISMQNPKEELRIVSGNDCRRIVKQLNNKGEFKRINRKGFYEIIQYGTWLKITQNESILKLFLESDLPFIRYHLRPKNGVVEFIVDNNTPMMVFLNELRDKMKEDSSYEPPLPDISEIQSELHSDIRRLYMIG